MLIEKMGSQFWVNISPSPCVFYMGAGSNSSQINSQKMTNRGCCLDSSMFSYKIGTMFHKCIVKTASWTLVSQPETALWNGAVDATYI